MLRFTLIKTNLVKKKPKPQAAVTAREHPVPWWWYAMLIAVIGVVYGRTFGYGFSPLDERWLITTRSGLLSDLRNLPQFFGEATLNLFYRPLLHVTFMLDWLAGGGSTTAFHLTNVLTHLACVLLFFRFLLLVNCGKQGAFACALVFAIHPLNVHAVAWVPGRNDTLLCMLALVACNCLLRYLRSKDLGWLFFHFASLVLALFTKETACLLPLLFGGLLVLYGESISRLGKGMLCGAWLLLATLRYLLQLHYVTSSPHARSIDERLPEFVNGLIMQYGKMFLPVSQSVYPLSEYVSLIPFVLVLLVVAFCAWKWKMKNKALGWLGIGWSFVFLLLPVWFGAGTDPSVHYEHRAYFSLMGVLIFVSQIDFPLSTHARRIAVTGVVVLFAAVSAWRCTVYADALTFSVTACEEVPGVAVFHDFAGFELQQRKQHAAALTYFNEAVRLDPSTAEFYNHRGATRNALRDYRNAISDYTQVLHLQPRQRETFVSRSIAWYSVREYDSAVVDLRRADSLGAFIDPAYINALNAAVLRRDSAATAAR